MIRFSFSVELTVSQVTRFIAFGLLILLKLGVL
jgi:hypothetical protein